MGQSSKTILLFGDSTEPWTTDVDQLYQRADSLPWLRSFLAEVTEVIKTEKKHLEPFLQQSLGEFKDLQCLSAKYHQKRDELSFVHGMMVYVVRAAHLLHCIKQEPHLLDGSETLPIGVSGGLLNASCLSVSRDFQSLYEASIETTKVYCRFCRLAVVRSRAIEDQPGSWGWAVMAISADELRQTLQQFQDSVGVPAAKRAKVGIVGDRWSTVIGPPSVLGLFFNQCPSVRKLPRDQLNIGALQHTMAISEADLDYIVGDSTLLKRPLIQDFKLWGIDQREVPYADWDELIRDAILQVLARPLDIVEAVGWLRSKTSSLKKVELKPLGPSTHTAYISSTLKSSGIELSIQGDIFNRLPETPANSPGRIAIVGMAGVGPGCNNLSEFWDIIMRGQDLAREVPADRYDITEFFAPEHKSDECSTTTKFGCFIDKPGHFDARFFQISPREAQLMDPSHRLFLMKAYEALEMAGYSSNGPAHTRSTDPHRIGTFFGQCNDDWRIASHDMKGCDAYTLQSTQRAFGPGRIAFHFGWEGPTYSLDSACSSTSSAIHLAAMSLLSGDIDMAVTGAGNIVCYPHSMCSLSKSGVLSDTGNCKPYRDDADGYCRADFVGAIVLKRLEDAVANNDNILAVVAGTGRNHSGNSTSITTSDAGAQERLFRNVLRDARVSANDVSFVEMHGTGTQVGDPAEMGAVTSVFQGRSSGKPLPVGAVKGNFGHSESAAGMASLLKCLLMFQNDTVPPQAGMPHALNPKFPPLSTEGANVHIPSTPEGFPREQGKPRRILLNNFDAAGGNTCVLLEDFPSDTMANVRNAVGSSCHVVVTSAKTAQAHKANQRNLLAWLHANRGVPIQDVAYTTTARRTHHSAQRFACAVTSTEDLIAKLEKKLDGTDMSEFDIANRKAPVIFMFTGQGSHYVGMGRELYATNAMFRQSMDLCVRLSEDFGFPPFLSIITNSDNVEISGMNTAQTQLAVISLEIALAAFWKSIGIEADGVVGHSLGEYAALHVSGVLSLADALYLVGHRAMLLMQRCDEGACAMLAVAADSATVQEYLDPEASCGIACLNSPNACVVSGPVDDVVALQHAIQTKHQTSSSSGLSVKHLDVPFGFHSFQMEPIMREYATIASGVTYCKPRIPVASTLLGAVVDDLGTFNADYMVHQTRQPVNFVGAIHAAQLWFSAQGKPLWLEIGPSPVCGGFVRATLSPSPTAIMTTLESRVSDWTSVSKCLSAIYVSAIEIDWLALHRPHESSLRLLALPSYAWDLKDYWITYEAAKARVPASALAPAQAPSYVVERPISTCAQRVVTTALSPSIALTMSASLAEPGFRALIQGHRIRGVPLCPGTAFAEAALTAAQQILLLVGRETIKDPAQQLAIRNMLLKRPLTEMPGAKLLTTVEMEDATADTIQVKFKMSSDRATYDVGGCRLEVRSVSAVQEGWDKTCIFVKKHMDSIIEDARVGSSHKLQPNILYALFASTVQYESPFQCIQEAYVSNDFTEAVAEVVLRRHPDGSHFTASPYWGEALAHLAGFLVNGNPDRSHSDSTYIMDTFDSFDQTASLDIGRSYFTYARVSNKVKEAVHCDVFVFDDQDKVILQCSGLRFHEVNNATLDRLLGKPASAPNVNLLGKNEPVRQNAAVSDSKEYVRNAKGEIVTQRIVEQQVSESTKLTLKTEVFDKLLAIIADETGTDLSELTDDMAIADVGVDSILATEIAAHVNNDTDLSLLPSFVVEFPTIGHLRRAFGSPSTQSSSPPAPASTCHSSQTIDNKFPAARSRTGTSTLPPSSSSVVLVERVEQTEKSPTRFLTPEPEKAEATNDGLPDNYPLPRVRISLIQGRPAAGKRAFYIIADGHGTIATYIHLPPIQAPDTLVYGVDSPFLHCPKRFTLAVGIVGAAKFITEALASHQPTGPFYLGGFSGGAMLGYEVSRQLAVLGRKVEGLILIDMCCPRPSQSLAVKKSPSGSGTAASADEAAAADVEFFEVVPSHLGLLNMPANTQQHLRAVFASISAYHPRPMTAAERPARTIAIWAKKGMVNRCLDNPEVIAKLSARGLGPDVSWPGFMEDPRLGAIAWSILDKTERDLGPNGWDKFIGGSVRCLAVDADHLEMVTPGKVHLLREAIEGALVLFWGGR